MDYEVSKWQSARTKPTVAGLYQTRNFWKALFFNEPVDEHVYHLSEDAWYIIYHTEDGRRMYLFAPVQNMQWRGVEYE
jgi:hypothetical protein